MPTNCGSRAQPAAVRRRYSTKLRTEQTCNRAQWNTDDDVLRGNTRVGFSGSLIVKRKDWGVSWNMALEAGGVVVSENVTLEFDISATRNS
jgi:hypothetical protein